MTIPRPILSDFIATRVFFPDMREHSELADYYECEAAPVPAFIYSGAYYIEILSSGKFGVPIENTYREFATLDAAEAYLFDYAEPDLYYIHNRG